ncbi:Nucleolar MIF4G domain-containing protein 1 [Frankliniella fusca]|uniref:Nucleolar MIF4G domain-containing protein 1 n=1 Tax=Frankliniella fusca TaxID=407009 RepID=A0AAE1HLY8_9NEOP|nr:Nucleolar MIF4G domain-containing protein 1 [Frankliniella fusca]
MREAGAIARASARDERLAPRSSITEPLQSAYDTAILCSIKADRFLAYTVLLKMGKWAQRKKGGKHPVQKTRKEIRKEQRKEKKLKRTLRHHPGSAQANAEERKESKPLIEVKKGKGTKLPRKASKHAHAANSDEVRSKEKDKQEKLVSDMLANRKKQLLAANKEEDRNIKHLEKLLRLNRSKRKSLPKSFADDGLDLLEVCDPEKMKESVKVDQALQDSGSEFEEDFAVVTGKAKVKKKKDLKQKTESNEALEDENTSDEDGESYSGSGLDSGSDFGLGVDDSSNEEMDDSDMSDLSENEVLSGDEEMADGSNAEMMEQAESEEEASTKSKKERAVQTITYCKKVKFDLSTGKTQEKQGSVKGILKNASKIAKVSKNEIKQRDNDVKEGEDEDYESDDEDELENSDDDAQMKGEDKYYDTKDSNPGEVTRKPDGSWQDIYGRMRDKDGNVVDEKPGKYIPPALRAKMQGGDDEKRKEILGRLKKQMKGLINRLAENNIASICTQIDELYMKNSRNDMNETILGLFSEALISQVLTPERLVMEHMLLIAVLHANVGSEVGAHFLQNMMKKFQEMLPTSEQVENKELDNVVLILSHLYNFKVLSASLMYEVLDKISEELNEKRIELLLVVLRSVGFSLRKDDPLALKSLILKLQGKAVNCPSALRNSSRVKFMLDILMAVKNNNMSKIPSYSPEHVEHLKKLLRTLVRRGNYIAELKISLEDLLNAEERGRWWIVGSAWTGHLPGENSSETHNVGLADKIKSDDSQQNSYSSQLLELAKRQRMNTGVRKDIFCILMTAEDFLDAFEKLLHLNLKNQQRQEIVHVLFDCCLQEKTFNPYYAHLSQKFCDFDRQYQMKFQYCLWDKLKELEKISTSQLSNMAKLLAHLFLERGLPLSALKVLSFAEMDKPCVRLVRQILLKILLSSDEHKCEAVFRRIAASPQLYLFREGLRLFINHFVLRKSSNKSLPDEEVELLKYRAAVADKALSSADSRLEF